MGMSSLTGGGGLSTSAGGGGPSRSGDASGISGTGNKTFNIGGNPNITSGSYTIPLVVGVLVLGFVLWKKLR